LALQAEVIELGRYKMLWLIKNLGRKKNAKEKNYYYIDYFVSDVFNDCIAFTNN